VTFDEYIKGGGSPTALHHLSKVSLPTIRKVGRREPIRLDVAWVLAECLEDGDAARVSALAHAMANPKPRRKLARKARG
jgi:hypothetical protein